LRSGTTAQSSELAYIPENNKVIQTFGHQPLVWASLSLIVAFFFGLQSHPPPVDQEFTVFAASAVLAFVFIAYEIRRRGRRTVLVKDGEDIAIYRRGRLDLVVPAGRISIATFRSGGLLHWGPFIGAPLALAGLLFVAVGVTVLSRHSGQAARTDGILILIMGFIFWTSLASALWTTFACAHLRLPVKGSKWTEEVLVSSSALKKVFPTDLIRYWKGSSGHRGA
jgi:hypothetical protein